MPSSRAISTLVLPVAGMTMSRSSAPGCEGFRSGCRNDLPPMIIFQIHIGRVFTGPCERDAPVPGNKLNSTMSSSTLHSKPIRAIRRGIGERRLAANHFRDQPPADRTLREAVVLVAEIEP